MTDMTHYSISPDGQDTPTLWIYHDEDPKHPHPIERACDVDPLTWILIEEAISSGRLPVKDYITCNRPPHTTGWWHVSRCDGELTFAPDPYALELDGDDTDVWMCTAHRELSAEDI